MGNADRDLDLPDRYLASPATEPIAIREVAIPAGGALTARWPQLQRYCGVKVGVENVGSAPCEFDGREGEIYVVRPGKTVVISLAEGVEEFVLRLRSTAGTTVRLDAVAARAARSLNPGVRKTVVRDPTTHLITSLIEEQVWVEHPPAPPAAER